MTLRSFCLVALTCILPAAALPQKKQLANSLDSLVKEAMHKLPVIPAISVSLVDENGPLLVKAYGWLDKDANIKADENSLFYIASNTKAFMALAAALLDQEKKILLDDPFKKYLPATTFKNTIGDNVTVRDLLNHTSGLDNNALVFRMAFSGQINNEDISRVLSNETSAKKQHGVYDYDNLGYNIYGLMLDQYLHKKWQDVLKEKIFSTLDMKRTTAYMSLAEKSGWPVAAPYFAFGEKGLTKLEQMKKDNTMQSAGGLITTASDMAKWLQMQINLGKVKNKQVFPQQVISQTQTGAAPYEIKKGDSVIRNKYGMGWNESAFRNERWIWHTGGYSGSASYVSFMPGKKIGLAIMTNESAIAPIVIELLTQYVYNRLTGVENAETVFAKRLNELKDHHDKTAVAVQKSYADRAKRTSQLTMPLETYTGTYHNDQYGDMEIKIENNTLGVHLGNIHAVSTPFTQKETIRVQFQPQTGEVISFKTDESGKVVGLVYNKLEFKKQ
jgi:CubicO group peptidase (beta-lactamase class C family)